MRSDRAARPTQSWPVAGRRLLTRREISADGRAVFGEGDPAWKGFYRHVRPARAGRTRSGVGETGGGGGVRAFGVMRAA
ncbi:hypothetical protein ACGFRG_24310 [Streptomyces sp. NPDC048696]|uniref:hypothetical protein n=1 Tax=Streptomyces sp. NPDC048696 TaxID=3365585 RepID=UPI003712573D